MFIYLKIRKMACIPNEEIYTVAEFKTLKKAMLTGTKEVQYADKRVVYRSMNEISDLIRIMQDAIWGHCPEFNSGFGQRRYAVSSKGIC